MRGHCAARLAALHRLELVAAEFKNWVCSSVAAQLRRSCCGCGRTAAAAPRGGRCAAGDCVPRLDLPRWTACSLIAAASWRCCCCCCCCCCMVVVVTSHAAGAPAATARLGRPRSGGCCVCAACSAAPAVQARARDQRRALAKLPYVCGAWTAAAALRDILAHLWAQPKESSVDRSVSQFANLTLSLNEPCSHCSAQPEPPDWATSGESWKNIRCREKYYAARG